MIKKLFGDAVIKHKEGRLEEAELLYRQILNINPKHADTNHNLAIIAMALGKYEETSTKGHPLYLSCKSEIILVA